MNKSTRPLNRGAISLLSSLAFVVAGGTVAVAFADNCFNLVRTGTCCISVSMDCVVGGEAWTCTSTGVGTPIQVYVARQVSPGVSGKKGVITSTSSCTWTMRECGPTPGSCIDVGTFVKTCSTDTTTGDPCVGAAN